MRTGLLDALERGLLAEAGIEWSIADFRPGNQPLASLTSALLDAIGGCSALDQRAIVDARLARGPRGLVELLDEIAFPLSTNLLLLVDQFEELFRFRRGEAGDEGDAFVALLLESARQRGRRIYVVITMRSDFLGECGRFSGLAEAINDGQFLTPRLTRQQCREAIEGPARVYGQRVEQALVTRMLNDIGSNPDQLPLMQHILMLMWRDASKRNRSGTISLTLAGYNALGGIGAAPASENVAAGDTSTAYGESRGALSNHADEILMSLSSEQRRLAATLFRALVQTEGNIGRDVRRPVALSSAAQICEVDPETLVPIVEAFRAPGRHFLTPSLPAKLEPDTVIDITRESLTRQWHTLSNWVRAEFDSAERYRHIEKNAQLWKRGEQDLLTMPYLGLALAWRRGERPNAAWAARYGGDFDLAMRYLNLSANRRSLRRRLSRTAIGFVVFASAIFAVVQFQVANKAKNREAALEALLMEQDSVKRIQTELQQAKIQFKGELAEELTDYGIPPQDTLKEEVGAQTPITIPGGTVVATKDLYDIVSSDPAPLLIDALRDSHIGTIPGAVRIPFAGFAGDWNDRYQRRLKVRLDNLTNGNLNAALVFFCQGPRCWESYNAALRAMHAGYTHVYWYRGGLASWKEAGLGLQFVFEQAQELKQKFSTSRAILPRKRWALVASLSEAADALLELSALDGAFNAAKAANDELQSLTTKLVDNPDFLSDLAISNMRLAGFLEKQDRRDMALAHIRQAKENWERLAQTQSDAAAWQSYSSEAYRQLGDNFSGANNLDQALEAYRMAQTIDQQLVARQPNDIQLQRDWWLDLMSVGSVLEKKGQDDEALARFRESLEIMKKLAAIEPKRSQWETNISLTRGWIGHTLSKTGRLDEALVVYRERFDAALLVLLKNSKSAEARRALSDTIVAIDSLARRLIFARQFSKALEAADLASSLTPDTPSMKTNRAHALMFLGRVNEARTTYFAFRGQKIQADKVWEEVVRADFVELRKQGLSHPLMSEVERSFDTSKSAQAGARV